ncbi:ABC transporter permease [Rubrobacter aplysinae]|uniref:ABC transporter permease n=1 Tax=Rubrobacter aplysinae TaxID=909625 RepID=UPI00064BD8D5|nr:ABC transporter permease [Rubrobacter aplysinae]
MLRNLSSLSLQGTLADKPFLTLLSREIRRFMRVWTQTIVPPLLTSLLYIVVFGVALGSRIDELQGVPYLTYILPGIAFMSLITGANSNSSSSVFDAKRERYIDEVLVSPMSDLQIALAYVLGGTLRGVIVGTGIFIVTIPFVDITIQHPLLLFVIGILSAFIFSSVGTMVGVLATRVDHISFLTNVVVQPLTFLGGVFYSVNMLPDALRIVTLFNPIFYIVDAARYAALEASDLNPYPTLVMVVVFCVLSITGAWWSIHRGPTLRY